MKKQTIVDGIRIDIPALLSMAHQCRPGLCSIEQNCCSAYEVAIEPREEETIVGSMPLAARYAPGLVAGDTARNVFDDDDDGSLVLDTDPEGYCVFSYRSDPNQVLCSLHTAALDIGLPPHKIKPFCCTLWPLSLEGRKNLLLSIHHDAFEFPCNKRRPPNSTDLDPGLAHIIQSLWNKDFLNKIIAAL